MGTDELNGDSFQPEAIDSDLSQLYALVAPEQETSSQSVVGHILAFIQQGVSVQALANWLPQVMINSFDLQGCHIELIDPNQRLATLVGGAGDGRMAPMRQSRTVASLWNDLYKPLSVGKPILFSSKSLAMGSTAGPLICLGCPMMNRTELLGNLWLMRPSHAPFDDIEINQLQKIANCFAIALHQTHLEATLKTQQTEIQRLRRAKDEFLQLISHELFVPLGNIQLSTQTLEKIFKDTAWRQVPQRSTILKVLSLLRQECHRQKQFVDNLVTLMFPEYQKTSETMLVNLSDWLPSLLRTFESRFKQESLKLKLSIPKDPLLYECDIPQLERTITELITNAIKYTPSKKTITITVKPTDTDIGIAIANTGVHIPANHQPHIFEKFYRVPELDQRQYGGSGLGLALVKQLVTNLDGTIEMKSTKQKTTFTIKLPREHGG